MGWRADMHIEAVRQHVMVDPKTLVLHVGDINAKFWFTQYRQSQYQKVLWATLNQDCSLFVNASLSEPNPRYFFMSSDKTLDNRYKDDMSFRFTFDTDLISTVVFDASPSNPILNDYLEGARNVLGLCHNLRLLYVKSGFTSFFDDFAKANGFFAEYEFEMVNPFGAVDKFRVYRR